MEKWKGEKRGVAAFEALGIEKNTQRSSSMHCWPLFKGNRCGTDASTFQSLFPPFQCLRIPLRPFRFPLQVPAFQSHQTPIANHLFLFHVELQQPANPCSTNPMLCFAHSASSSHMNSLASLDRAKKHSLLHDSAKALPNLCTMMWTAFKPWWTITFPRTVPNTVLPSQSHVCHDK